MPDARIQTSLRLPGSALDRADALVDRMPEHSPDGVLLDWTRSAVIRAALELGLRKLEAKHKER